MSEVAIIIQARMGSSRLPGKVLKLLINDHVLGTLCRRIAPSQFSHDIIIATTTNPIDDPIHSWGLSAGYRVYRGSENDVLDRYHAAFRKFVSNASILVRICADNPLLNFRVIDEMLHLFKNHDYDYISNSGLEKEQIEDGFVVEVFSPQALILAHKKATLLSDREHVCTYMKKHLKSRIVQVCPGYKYKLSVDTEEDFSVVQTILLNLGDSPEIGMQEVNQLLLKHPEIGNMNSSSQRNAGYLKSLEEDQNIEPNEYS